MRKTDTPELIFHPEFCQETLCHSDTALRCGLENCCPPDLTDNLARLSALLASIQSALGLGAGALKVNSGFRSAELNEKVGGVPNSQHCLGLAADVVACDWGSPGQLAKAIEESNVAFDQLILEFPSKTDPAAGWVHVSYKRGANRKQVQTAVKEGGKTVYKPGLLKP